MNATEIEQPETGFPTLPLAAAARAGSIGWRAWLLPVSLTAVILFSGIGWAVFSPPGVDSNTPRVEMDIQGMHCPVQCGLRVAHALESLPWVIKGSVEADPTRGRVTFAVTDPAAVDADVARDAVNRTGFRSGDVRLVEREQTADSDPN